MIRTVLIVKTAVSKSNIAKVYTKFSDGKP